MKANILFFIFVLSSFLSCSTTVPQTKVIKIDTIGEITPRIDEKSDSGFFIPRDLNECLDEYNIMLNDTIKDSLKAFDYRKAFYRYRMLIDWTKKNWNIKDSSQLVLYFSEFGFNDPDVVANGIFRLYWNYLNGKPLKIEIKPKVYSIGKNLFIHPTDSLIIYSNKPAPFGSIVPTDSSPQFIFMGRKFTLIDSLYDPIIDFIRENGFEPSDSLWYIWWTRVTKFGVREGNFPYFLSEEDLNRQYRDGGSYNGDYIMIIEDANKYKMKWFMRNNKYDKDFLDYVSNKKHLLFYLIRKREVHYFDY